MSNHRPTTRDFLDPLAKGLVFYGMWKASRILKEVEKIDFRTIDEEAKEQALKDIEEEIGEPEGDIYPKKTPTGYHYVFRGEAIPMIKDTMSELLMTIMGYGIPIEQDLLDMTRSIIDTMENLMNETDRRNQNGNQAQR